MSDFSTLELIFAENGVATLWLNRPDKNNAFDAQMINELHEALQQVAAQQSARFLLLRGRGKHFSAGADLAWMQASSTLSYHDNLLEAQRLGELMDRLYQLPLPTLAVVQGAAFAGAMGLVCCCDMAIGSDDALFSLSEVRLGLAPAVISPYVVQAIGQRAARRYALSADRFDAHRARELGLLAEVYPEGELDIAVRAWTRTLLKNSPAAMSACKSLLLAVGDGELSAELKTQTASTIASLRTSEEGQEGMRAFLEKRAPAWNGETP
jgi:methylglutaconyl-CoA hydratase